MPRKARIDAPGALHHIIIRGIERKAIFKVAHCFKIDPQNLKSASKERIVTEARRVLCYIAVRKLGYKCSDISRALDISASTASNAVRYGSRISEIGKLQKQILGN